MSEQQPNEPMSFSRFADWCRHIDSLSEEARHTVKVLLNKAGTDDPEAAEQILSSMTTLNLSHNPKITDISSLGSLTNLTELYLSFNGTTDIRSLSSLTNLTRLYLNGIIGENVITDISSLRSLTNLTILFLSDNEITDITSLGALINLTTLDITRNPITDISSLRSLTNLTTLYLGSRHITDITSLGALTNLTTLLLGGNQITDISSLGSLTNLTTLFLSGSQITDISSLGSLTSLTTLEIKSSQITDISALRSLTNLTTLDLWQNQITDISSLGSLTNLRTLQLSGNKISDISPLRSLTHLTMLHLDSRQIAVFSVLGELAQKRLTLSTRPIDAEQATAAVKVAYAAIGLEAPEVIICSSPRDAFLQIFNLLKCDRSPNFLDRGCRNRSGQKLDWKSMSRSIVTEFASHLVWEYEIRGMRIDPEADSTLSSLMNEFADEYARSEPTMGHGFSDYLSDLTSPETPTNLFKEIYLTELYISLLGVNLSQKAQEILRCQKLLLEDCGFIFPFEKICVVCDRPRHLRFDSENRLHAEAEPAIEFADGWNFYYYHGVRLPEQYGQVHPNLWKAEWILSEDNAEVRRVLIEAIGYDRICQELSAQQIDSWQKYELLKIDNADVEPICLLKMTCPSTGFIHALRVPPEVRSAREAIRWVNGGIDPEEFSMQT
ncbi:leucine-rich repeat domain-containing protein [Microcoleus sp. CAWBG58]|uniref:leucine-rich repeat domain-containing protein n=1 Tax=Microcoleus sp. CAWBG58 TaxID=2841651 RepID=UPI0025E7B7D6|nr:leucine-rich repeat domain-containing protein [Microcoleus sp. CAWBG58]